MFSDKPAFEPCRSHERYDNIPNLTTHAIARAPEIRCNLRLPPISPSLKCPLIGRAADQVQRGDNGFDGGAFLMTTSASRRHACGFRHRECVHARRQPVAK